MKKTIVYKQGHNYEILGDFYPVSTKNRPVIVYIHGGGLLWGSREDLKIHQVEYYHQAGFNVFSIDYRLAPESKLPDIVEDVESALQWIEREATAHFDVDSSKIAVIGSSAGAYLALMSGTFQRKPQAIVSFYGYGDITGDWAIRPNRHYQAMTAVPQELADMLISNQPISVGPIEKRYAIYMHARQQGQWIDRITGLNPVSNKSELATFCPLSYASEKFPPTLLLHGTKDEDVPYEQSLLMNNALSDAGTPSKLITIPDAGHVFDDDWSHPVVQHAFEEVISFLQTHLK